jgi:hypothetical protein
MTRPGIMTERLFALFLLGIIAFTPPFLGIFNTPRLILGIPILYLYLFGTWGLLIGLVALTVHRTAGDDDNETTSAAPGDAAGNGEV